jgi:hypothetical protein
MRQKITQAPLVPELKSKWREVHRRPYATIREYAEALLQLVHHRDADGRAIGFDYKYIRDAILKKYPTVPLKGPEHLNYFERLESPYRSRRYFDKSSRRGSNADFTLHASVPPIVESNIRLN